MAKERKVEDKKRIPSKIYKKEKDQQTKRQKEMAWVMLNPRKCAKKTEYKGKHRDV